MNFSYKSDDEAIREIHFDKEESRRIVRYLLEDYYRTLDDNFLKEAVQLAKDEDINIREVMESLRKDFN
ncbi:MAG: hypothetical protein Kow0037_27820 [Calditrichia bacterium]